MRGFSILCLLLASFCAAQIAPPRLTQVLPHPYIPYGCAIEDFNGDNLPDILLGISSGEYHVLTSNLGNRSFGPLRITHYVESGANFGEGLPSVVRLDNSSALHIFFNQYVVSGSTYAFTPTIAPMNAAGTGKIGKRTTLGAPSAEPWHAFDLDGDGSSEFLQRVAVPSGTTIRIYDRQSDGTYLNLLVSFADAFALEDASFNDLDGDGDLDLSYSINRNITVVERTGHRNFAITGTPLGNTYDAVNKPADLDGDGRLDFHTRIGTSLKWFRNLGNLAFAPAANAFPNNLSNSKLLKIIPQPGASSIFHVSYVTSGQITMTALRFGSWTTVYQRSVTVGSLPGAYPSYPDTLALEDFDQDGILDLLLNVNVKYTAGRELGTNRLAVAWGAADKFEPPVYILPPPITTRFVLTEDFNQDGSIDVVTGPDFTGKYHLLLNTGDGNFVAPQELPGLTPDAGMPPDSYIAGLRAGRLDNDTLPDLAVDYADPNGFAMTVIARGNGTGGFTRPVLTDEDYVSQPSAWRVTDHLVDWDGDGDLDAIGQGALRENLGGTFSSTLRTLISPAQTAGYLGGVNTRVGDLDGDGRPDIVCLVYRITNSIGNPVSTLAVGYNNGLGGVGTILEAPINMLARDALNRLVAGNLMVGDLNGDGRPDLVTQQFSHHDSLNNIYFSTLLRINPAIGSRTPGSWALGSLSVFPSGPRMDFTGDGIKEFVIPFRFISPASPNPVVSPQYRFTGNISLGLDTTAYPGDFDGDGDTDFLIGFGGGGPNLTLVKNPLVDEQSGITRSLLTAGVKGSEAGPEADADNDGRNNRNELTFGTDPLVSDTQSPNPLGVMLDPNPERPSLSFRVPILPAALRLRHQLEHSENLLDWIAVDPQPSVISQSGGWKWVQTQIPTSLKRSFYRVRGIHEIDDD